MAVEKSMDRKIANILADSSCNEFMIADAKDADMAFGLAAPGQSPEHHSHEGKFRSLAEYRDIQREVLKQGLVDILLMSASTCEQLCIQERLFDQSAVTPAARANDTTDVWVATGAKYPTQPAKPFRSASIDHIMCGKLDCATGERKLGADLGLYSLTFNNDIELDYACVEQYKTFREEAERKGFRHFLEVFDPNAPANPIPDIGRFLSDMITRVLAGVTSAGRPVFLKIPYHGPAAMEALAAYDPKLIPGILGGSSGTTYDAFHQLWEAKKYGARIALYGRMINHSEHQLHFIQHLRWLADGQIDPAEAVKSYHGALAKEGIKPYRELSKDLEHTKRAANYGGTGGSSSGSKPAAKPASPAKKANTISTEGEPDFSSMSPQEKIAYQKAKWDRILG